MTEEAEVGAEIVEEVAPEEEIVPAEEIAEAVEEAAPPLEPDGPAEDEEEMPEVDPPGIVTKLSKDKFKKLRSAWLGNGKPRRLTAFGAMWHVYDSGSKYVSRGAPGAMGDYGSLSTSRVGK